MKHSIWASLSKHCMIIPKSKILTGNMELSNTTQICLSCGYLRSVAYNSVKNKCA